MRFIPIVLSLLVLSAHFLRGGCLPVVMVLVALIALLAVRKPWVARTAQVVLGLGALEWIRTAVTLTLHRMDTGEPYLRMVLILGVVAAVTIGSALLFESAPMRKRYGLGGGEPAPAAGE